MNKCKKCKDNKSIYVLLFERGNPKPAGIHIWNNMKMIGSYALKGISIEQALRPLYYCLNCHSLISGNKYIGLRKPQRFKQQ